MTTDPRARCPHCQLWTVAVVQQDPRVEQCTACGRQPTDDAARRFLRPDHQVIADLEADVRRLTTERDEALDLAESTARDLSDCTTSHTRLRVDLADARRDVENHRSAARDLDHSLADALRELADARAELATEAEAARSWREIATQNAEQCDRARAEVTRLRAEVTRLRAKISERNERHWELQNTATRYRDALTRIRDAAGRHVVSGVALQDIAREALAPEAGKRWTDRLQRLEAELNHYRDALHAIAHPVYAGDPNAVDPVLYARDLIHQLEDHRKDDDPDREPQDEPTHP